MDDLDDLLGRGERPHHLFAHGPLLDPVDEGLGDLVIDVGLESARRTSRRASPTWASVSLPWPFSFLKAAANLSVKRSNIA